MDFKDTLPNRHAERMIAISRRHFGLAPSRRNIPRLSVLLRWLRMALLAGGLGPLAGSAAMADDGTRSATPPDDEPSAVAVTETRRSVERMP